MGGTATDYGVSATQSTELTDSTAFCACVTPVVDDGCAELCSNRDGGTASANFCEGAGASTSCSECVGANCPGDFACLGM